MKNEKLKSLTIDSIFPNPNQPRKDFNEDRLEELAMSIRQYGVLEPIVVTPRGEGYMIVAGERRWRASRIAGRETIRATIIDADDALVEELALLENLQRDDLNVIEEANALQSLLNRGWTKEQIAKKIGFKQVWRIDERTSLLKLTEEHQRLAIKGVISNSQAFEMSRVPPETQKVILKKVLSGELGSYNKLRAFVDGLIAIERQECMLSLQSLTPSEEQSISEFTSLFRSIERFINSVNEKGRVKHFKKVVFHTDISVERMDIVIQQLMKLRKTVFEGAGIQSALKAV